MSRGIKVAGKDEPTPAGMERVMVMVTGAAQMDVFMPTGMADRVDESDPAFIDEVTEAAGEELCTALDFEVDVLHVVPARLDTHKATG